MGNQESAKTSIRKIGSANRKAVKVSSEELIKAEPLQTGRVLPLLVRPALDGLDLVAWAEGHREFIETQLIQNGGILFRDFNVKSVDEFEQFIKTISGELLEYTYRSTPRTRVSGQIHTSTEYPADRSIQPHNEMSYARNWPLKIWFFCVQAAEKGGETPIADSRKIFQRIDPGIRQRFMEKKVMYIRTYGGGLDLPWEDVFQTQSRAEAEDYCRKAGIEFEWKGKDQLKTRQVCDAVTTHPKTGERVWFNQAHLFHVSSLTPEARESLLSVVDEEDLPRDVHFGDGSKIEDSMLDEIRGAYKQEAVLFSWQTGDVLMLDNMLTSHGRQPYVGARKVVVGMAESFGSQSM